MSDEVERTLCQLPECFVYKAPTRTSADGYRADAFPPQHMWQGKLKIVVKGREACIFLIDANNAVFAACPVTEGSVEPCVGSSRYFVLKIVNPQGKHAYIGLVFNDRNYAFDFNVALQEHKRSLLRIHIHSHPSTYISKHASLSCQWGENENAQHPLHPSS